MQRSICEELIKEDTFNFFRQDLLEKLQKDDCKTIIEIKQQLTAIFTNKIMNCEPDTLLFYESTKMIRLLEDLVKKYAAMYADHTDEDNDIVVKLYCESLNDFIRNVKDNDIINYVNSINK